MTREPPNRDLQALVIGASAGAVEALLCILPSLPADYPLVIIIVVHLPPHGESILASLLATRCQIAVKEAEDKELVRPGTAYLAPPNYHLLVEPDLRLALSVDD
ncbi:MAG: chemotaxis protein CheB, partial [Verrucomicrobiaceae bacterium]|nr:chemotaxis protein CheB [Verrucomicrobiaceae bacterium]